MPGYEQPSLFDGTTLDPRLDDERLRLQLRRVFAALSSTTPTAWWTLSELARVTESPEASVSARLRDLRKAKHGGHVIERRRIIGGYGLHEYRLNDDE